MTRLVLPPVLTTVVLGIIAVLSIAFHQALLAPSLAAAAFSQMLHPKDASASPFTIAVGQIIGAAAGFLAVFLTGQVHTPPFPGTEGLTGGRTLAVVVALLLAAFAQILSGAKTPAGAATALTVALGLETANLAGAGRLLVGILLVSALGEGGRRLLAWAEGRGDGAP